MEDLQIIKEFLRAKSSYLKCGQERINQALSSIYNGQQFDYETIKKAKKEVKKEFKRTQEPVKESKRKEILFNPNQIELGEELILKFNEIAKKLGMMGLEIPKSDEDTMLSFIQRKRQLRGFHTPSINDQVGTHLLLGCNHVPFHHKRLHDNILELIKDIKDDLRGFHLLGDFLDLNTLSSHDKGKFTAVRGLTLDDEYQEGNDLLNDFNRVLPKDIWKTYIYGNHEDRYNRWMKDMNNYKTPIISPEHGLNLWEKGYNVKNDWSHDYITIGNDFDIFHGIYYSIHNAKAHLDKLRRNCAYVHTHRTQMYREGRLAAYNIGACANFESKAFGYASRVMKASWANGFGILNVAPNGSTHFTQIHVEPDGSFFFGNKFYN